MKIEQIHHVAYRCKDAKETVNWYVDNAEHGFRAGDCRGQGPLDA
jgi:catechol 2,3-dioxygenase-like lactoylglutathione lyase family enzyme